MDNNAIGHKFQQKKVQSKISAKGYLTAVEANAFNAGISYAYELLDERYPELELRDKVEVMFSEMRNERSPVG